MAFDFKKSLIKVQGGRQYLPVSARIVWFREQHPDWAIVTEPLEINHEKQYSVFRATVFDADGKIRATGTKKEDIKGFGDYIEKSETGAVGRALALCGYGTQFSPELDETHASSRFADSPRYADSPQPMGGSYGARNGGGFSNGYATDRSAIPAEAPPIRPAAVEDSITTHAALETASDGAEAAEPACSDCGKRLTKGQMDLSLRNYGEALCPSCQREKPKAVR